VKVMRSVMRIIAPSHHYDPSLLNMSRHHDSRSDHELKHKGYRDFSQAQPPNDPGVLDYIGGEILKHKEANTLSLLGKVRSKQDKIIAGEGWLAEKDLTVSNWPVPVRPPPEQTPTSPEDEDEAVWKRTRKKEDVVVRRNWKGLKKDFNVTLRESTDSVRVLDYVNRMPPVQRHTKSMPSLAAATRFGENYEALIHDPFTDMETQARKFEPPSLYTESPYGEHTLDVLGKFHQKPNSDLCYFRRDKSKLSTGLSERPRDPLLIAKEAKKAMRPDAPVAPKYGPLRVKIAPPETIT